MPLVAEPRVVFPSKAALHVVHLACERPDTLSRSLSPWDGTEPAHQLIAEGIVEDISAATVRRMLACHHPESWRYHRWLQPKQPRAAAFYATMMKRIDLDTRPLRANKMDTRSQCGILEYVSPIESIVLQRWMHGHRHCRLKAMPIWHGSPSCSPSEK